MVKYSQIIFLSLDSTSLLHQKNPCTDEIAEILEIHAFDSIVYFGKYTSPVAQSVEE